MKNKIKIEKEEKYYLFIILIGIVLTFLIYYFYRQFYLSLVPLLVSLSVSFILFYFNSELKKRKVEKKAESMLGFYMSINQQLTLGNSFKDSAIKAISEIVDENLKKDIQEYFNEENVGSGVLDISILNTDTEKKLCSLFLYGITHQINAEFKDNFFQLCDMYKDEVNIKIGNKNNYENYIEYISVFVTLIIAILLTYKLFNSLL